MKKNFTFFLRRLFSFLIVFFLFILFSEAVNAQPTNQTFNASGTYVVPAGYSANVTIECWGGGGGGGTNSGNAKGGGGGGAYASITTILAAGSYAVTVGAGGSAGNAGGNSSFTVLVIAAGGSSTTSPTGGAGGTTVASTGTILFAGGNGGDGGSTTGIRGGGGGGGSAFASANGGNGTNGSSGAPGTGGNGGNGAGTGGNGADDDGTPDATPGITPGSGGGGRGTLGNSKSGASGQVIVTFNSVLPVKFGNIRAYEKQSGIQIDWTVYSEVNLSGYEIERSDNGRSFSAIGNVKAYNLNTETKYSWLDVNPLTGASFYRLKSIDSDGKTGYSTIVKINLSKIVKDISVYPNPAVNDNISFQISDLQKGNYKIKIFNSNGQQVSYFALGHSGGTITQAIQLPTGTLPGIYMLMLEGDDLKLMSKSFIVQ